MYPSAGIPAAHGDTKTALAKTVSGISGLDDITNGGLPEGRPTLVAGKAGSGKTLFAMQFLVSGATDYNEPGVFVSFEEREEDLIKNVRSLGFDLPQLIAEKKIVLEHIQLEQSEIEEIGDYNLDGLFIRLAYAIDSIGAKRVALDTIETLFASLGNEGILRAELRRLFFWLKEKGVTAVVTGESGQGNNLTRNGLEEYVSDCVIYLDHRVNNEVSTRRLRIVKYRGSAHGTNEYPFLITPENGITIMPVTTLGLMHEVLDEHIPTGIPRLDTMLGGEGYYRGSSILVSGTPGTGKTSIAATFAEAACRRNERCIYFTFEESPGQIIRNMRSIGIDLAPMADAGLLTIHASRPMTHGLETHLATMIKTVQDLAPDVVIVDPVSSLITAGEDLDTKSMLTRLIDYLKVNQITGLFTDLTQVEEASEQTRIRISSLMDTWILLRSIESGGEHNRVLYVLKSRGMAHSNQVREFVIADEGIDLLDVYLGPAGVLTGSARYVQEAKERAEAKDRAEELRKRKIELERKQKAIEAQIAALEAEHEAHKAEFERYSKRRELDEEVRNGYRRELARRRRAD
ncbi:MAG TPA: circadian clock protein KaiC [Methanoculleus sp.]|nr:circadian clock protein KaiC [Methanoculleus sp.]